VQVPPSSVAPELNKILALNLEIKNTFGNILNFLYDPYTHFSLTFAFHLIIWQKQSGLKNSLFYWKFFIQPKNSQFLSCGGDFILKISHFSEKLFTREKRKQLGKAIDQIH
jgi:hypothetical protein